MLAIVVKGYPRLSETFIAQEILALEQRGLDVLIVSLRHPTDNKVHEINRRIAAGVFYLPEYLHQEPLRVLRALATQIANPRLFPTLLAMLRDWLRDPTRNRVRRFGQALVFASEVSDKVDWIHCHYLHTPSAMTRYATRLRPLPWSISAHAKDIWTLPEWQKRQHLAEARWCVTCTAHNRDHLRQLAPRRQVELIYHGLDLQHVPTVNRRPPDGVLRIVTVARAVEKKGLDVMLKALAAMQRRESLRWVQIGAGPEVANLKEMAASLGIQSVVSFQGALTRDEVFEALAEADIFCLPARIARDGDRDGLPNSLMEAMYASLPVVASELPGIEELIEDGETGFLVPSEDAAALARCLERLRHDPELRERTGAAARRRILDQFQMDRGIDRLEELLREGARRCA